MKVDDSLKLCVVFKNRFLGFGGSLDTVLLLLSVPTGKLMLTFSIGFLL